jgi:hypothetical protein
MHDDNDELAGVRDLHKTLDEAIEVLAAFLSAAASTEMPPESLVTTAHQVIGDLTEWRATLWEITDQEPDAEGLH